MLVFYCCLNNYLKCCFLCIISRAVWKLKVVPTEAIILV